MRVPIYEAVAHYKRNETLPYTCLGYIGLFSTLKYAEKAIEWYKTWDIFKVHGIECLGINTITLNLRGWTEGFITVYE